MQADFSVELGREDPALELPWTSRDHSVCYYDLKHCPELVQQIPEAVAHPELGAFLTRVNAPGTPFETAKCDVWQSRDIAPEEEMFGTAEKFVSYVDLIFVDEAVRSSFEKHEEFAEKLCLLLGRVPDIPATVELIIRRCYFHQQRTECQGEIEQDSPGPKGKLPIPSKTPAAVGLPLSAFPLKNVSLENRSLEGVPSEEFPIESLPQEELPLSSLSSQGLSLQGLPPENLSLKSNSLQSDPLQSSPLENLSVERSPLQGLTQGRPLQSFSLQSIPLDDSKESISGLCLTAYVTGFGDSDHESRRQWAIALALLQHALMQASRQ